ncbi:MAG: phosphate ABC transporter substrate-binding protein [candidate division Zixibacteria bacterium]|nr:phosphate ABC transporter substrate-binding protein [candidate division Zixibacteria bacterium]
MKKNTLFTVFAAFVFCLLFSAAANAGNIVVIVNTSSDLSSATAGEVSKVFMGKASAISGTSVEAVDQVTSSKARIDFSEKILGRSVRKVTNYWKKRVFAGKGEPPKELANDAKVIAHVQSTAGAIGYISAESLSDAVKAVEVDGKTEW